MKQIKTALLIALLTLPLLGTAKDSSGSKKSFNSFSSSGSVRNSIPAPSAASPPSGAAKKTGFGSFSSAGAGSTIPKEALPSEGKQSVLAQGLNKNAAQSNALKTLDARNASKAAANATLAPAPSATPVNTPSAIPAQPINLPPSVYYSNNNNGGSSLSSGIMGFMLGRAMSNNNGNYNHGSDATTGSNRANQDIGYSAPFYHESMGTKLLRFLTWTLLLSVVGWVIWRLFFKTNDTVAKTANYTLN